MQYRPVTLQDARLLFDWRNDGLTRAMSRSSEPVEWSEHLAWLTKRLDRLEPHLYIAECEGRPIGTFRVDHDEVSYTVAPDVRMRGMGTALLKLARADFGVLRAEIFRRNEASIKAATAAGMTVVLID